MLYCINALSQSILVENHEWNSDELTKLVVGRWTVATFFENKRSLVYDVAISILLFRSVAFKKSDP